MITFISFRISLETRVSPRVTQKTRQRLDLYQTHGFGDLSCARLRETREVSLHPPWDLWRMILTSDRTVRISILRKGASPSRRCVEYYKETGAGPRSPFPVEVYVDMYVLVPCGTTTDCTAVYKSPPSSIGRRILACPL